MRLPIPPPRPSKRPLIAQGVLYSGRRCRVRCPLNSTAAKLLRRKTLSCKCKVLTRKKQVKKLPANAKTPTFRVGVEDRSRNHFSQQRRRADSNRRIKVLQTSPLPLGYVAVLYTPSRIKPRRLVGLGAAGSSIRGSVDGEPRCSYLQAPCPAFTGQSGKRDSNPRHQPWQGCALPTELFPQSRRNIRSPSRKVKSPSAPPYLVTSRISYFRRPTGTFISIFSPCFLPSRALPIGDVTEILLLSKSDSSGETSRYSCS